MAIKIQKPVKASVKKTKGGKTILAGVCDIVRRADVFHIDPDAMSGEGKR